MGSSCSNLSNADNSCDIYKCVEAIKGLDSNSSSPSDTAMIKFSDGTNYDGHPLKFGFMKWWITHSTLPSNVSMPYLEQGLTYELKIYRDIIKPLIDRNVCPNFVMFIGGGTGCPISTIAYIVSKTTKDPNERNKNIKRNFEFMLNRHPKRKAITSSGGRTPGIRDFWNSTNAKYENKIPLRVKGGMTVDFIVNEPMYPKNSATFWEYLSLGWRGQESVQILFQIIAGCYAMSLSKLTHNDLHIGNIWVVDIPETKVSYVINNRRYTFNTTKKVKIYDFDRGYAVRLGDNESLSGMSCYLQNQCNEFIENKDIVKFSCYLKNNPEYQRMMLHIITNVVSMDDLTNICAEGFFLRLHGNLVGPEYFKNFFSTLEILENISLELDHTEELANPENTYTCNASMFAPNGRLL